jgi:HK97 gp10 family phage protein
MKALTLMEFAELLGGLKLEVDHINHTALERAAKIVEKEAKDVLGTYRYGWPQLAPSTQKEREKQGFAPNEPLLRTGEMRDSIQHSSDHHEARIGSNSDIALYQELGTSKIPPRPFLQGALKAKMPDILDEIGREMVAFLSGDVVAGPNSMITK